MNNLINKDSKKNTINGSGYKDSQNEIVDLIDAKYALIHVVTEDEIPVIKTLVELAEKEMTGVNYNVLTWNVSSGIFAEHGKCEKSRFLVENTKTIEEKVEALYSHIKSSKENAIYILQDFDFILQENKSLSFGLKEAAQTIAKPLDGSEKLKRYSIGGAFNKHIVIVSSNQYIPKELDKLVNITYFGMPGRKEISSIIEKVAKHNKQNLTEDEKEALIVASHGLTENELTNALFKSIASSDNGKMNAGFISEVKKQIISKGGIIEYSEPISEGINSLGGMNSLKDWIKKRSIAFDEKLRMERKLKFPKGVLLTGVQGGGKSHAAKSIAGDFGLPLLRFDIGKVKGMYVGQSEENMRKAIGVAESVSPCVLWIDEIEKAFPDPRNANTHEVSKGLLGYFLTWMQEKKKDVFVIATANNIDSLPPELLRKGRFDEIFWVNLPDVDGRIEITKSKLKGLITDINSIDIEEVAKASEGYTGAEIEAAVNEANFNSAYDNQPLSTEYILEEISKTTPISVIRKDSIEEMQKWAKKNKVRSAN